MAQLTLIGSTDSAGARARPAAAPLVAVQVVGALLALAISTVHVADQGSVTAFASPSWIGWGYRIIEVGGVLTAITLVLPRTRWLGWAAGVLLGVGPFAAYILSRSVGVPGDPGEVGNWGYWVGTLSLFVEAALIALCVAMLLAYRPRSSST